MNDLAFTGKEHLIDLIRSACSAFDTQATMAILRDGLSALITSKSVYLPECVYEPVEGHYARREIYKCPETGVSVVAMTWGPGQGTPIHDHCGLWGVEGVWQGEIEIIQYELLEDHSERCRFERARLGTPEHDRNHQQDQRAECRQRLHRARHPLQTVSGRFML